MNTYIDIYCERLMPGFWAEPINALTNISFFVAAFFAWQLARQRQALDGPAGVLIFLLLCIGTGSFLFHTLAVRWAMLADALPILFYQIAFLGFYSRRILKWPRPHAAGLIAAFFATIYLFDQLPGAWFNGSLSYAPAILFLAGLGFAHLKKAGQEKYGLLIAAAVFFVSLTFRSLDMAVCAAFPAGLHMVWHMLNGLVLYLTARAFILNSRT